MRPLERIPSLKLKLGIIIVIGVAVSATVSSVGFRVGVPIWMRPLISAVIALLIVQFLARGMTRPLREMAAAAGEMAEGDLTKRVHTDSRDEVGQLATAFNAMAQDLERVDRIRRDLVANVSHELRTPITAIQARLENLVDGVDEPDPALLVAMLGQVERLGRLVSQLLDLSRLEAGTIPIEHVDIPVERLFADAVTEASIAGVADRVLVEVTPPDLMVSADPDRLLQVVVNLLANAVRHSPDDGMVTLRASERGSRIRLEVIDEGPGIDPEDVDRVFERFYRTDPARRTSDGGSGLGLAIAQWIVDLHKGSISIEANTPTGARMVVDLPERSR